MEKKLECRNVEESSLIVCKSEVTYRIMITLCGYNVGRMLLICIGQSPGALLVNCPIHIRVRF
jgi:hypothetical protein